jgi:hypothetical protein
VTPITALPVVLVLLAANASEPVWITDLRYCDIVVRGTIQSATEELKPENEATPMLPEGSPDFSVRVAMIRMTAEEVMRGSLTAESLEFVAFVGMSIFKNNYVVGQEIVVGLVWGQDVLGGSYWLPSEHARIIRDSAGWVDQGGGAVLTDLSRLKRSLSQVAPEQVMKESDVAITGEVRDVRVETIHGENEQTAVLMSIELKNVQSLSGQAMPSEITVKQITSGDFWPAWRDSAPPREMPPKGKQYCFFLRKIDDGYAVVRGINGMFEVRDGRLYFAGRTPVNLTTQQVGELWPKQ